MRWGFLLSRTERGPSSRPLLSKGKGWRKLWNGALVCGRFVVLLLKVEGAIYEAGYCLAYHVVLLVHYCDDLYHKCVLILRVL